MLQTPRIEDVFGAAAYTFQRARYCGKMRVTWNILPTNNRGRRCCAQTGERGAGTLAGSTLALRYRLRLPRSFALPEEARVAITAASEAVSAQFEVALVDTPFSLHAFMISMDLRPVTATN